VGAIIRSHLPTELAKQLGNRWVGILHCCNIYRNPLRRTPRLGTPLTRSSLTDCDPGTVDRISLSTGRKGTHHSDGASTEVAPWEVSEVRTPWPDLPPAVDVTADYVDPAPRAHGRIAAKIQS